MVKFVNITEEEFLSSKLLYKHLSLENALRTLEDKSFWFASPSTWKDPFEKRFLEARYVKDNGKKEAKFRWKKKVFCTCLTQTITSEAYWNNYSKGDIGIELRISREQLLRELEKYDGIYKIFIGKVEYKKTSDIKKDLSKIPFNPPEEAAINSDQFAARLFLLKRVAYAYEDEVRIIVVKKDATNEKGISIHYDCENTNIIRQIVLDPSIGDYTCKMLRKLFEDGYGFKPYINKGGREQRRVLRSQLYAQQKLAVLKID